MGIGSCASGAAFFVLVQIEQPFIMASPPAKRFACNRPSSPLIPHIYEPFVAAAPSHTDSDWEISECLGLFGALAPAAACGLARQLHHDLVNATDLRKFATHLNVSCADARFAGARDSVVLYNYALVVVTAYLTLVNDNVAPAQVGTAINHLQQSVDSTAAMFTPHTMVLVATHVVHCAQMATKHSANEHRDIIRYEGNQYYGWLYDINGFAAGETVMRDIETCHDNPETLVSSFGSSIEDLLANDVAPSAARFAGKVAAALNVARVQSDAPPDKLYLSKSSRHSENEWAAETTLSAHLPCSGDNVEVVALEILPHVWKALRLHEWRKCMTAITFGSSHALYLCSVVAFVVRTELLRQRNESRRWTPRATCTRMLRTVATLDIQGQSENIAYMFVPAVVDVTHTYKHVMSFEESDEAIKALQSTLGREVYTDTSTNKATKLEVDRIIKRTNGMMINCVRSFILCVGVAYGPKQTFVFVEMTAGATHGTNRKHHDPRWGAAMLGMRLTVDLIDYDDLPAGVDAMRVRAADTLATRKTPADYYADYKKNFTDVRAGKKIPGAHEAVEALKHTLTASLMSGSVKCAKYCKDADDFSDLPMPSSVLSLLSAFVTCGGPECAAVYSAVVNAVLQNATSAADSAHALAAIKPNAYIGIPRVQDSIRRLIDGMNLA